MGATAAIGVLSVSSAYAQGEAQRMQGQYQKNMADINARNAELSAEDSIKRGGEAAASYRKKINQTVGAQRAALAAQGIDVNADDALSLQDETRQIGEMDVLTIKNNALREAFGYKSQAQSYQSAGAYAEKAGNTGARNTLIGGGLQAASYAYSRNPKGKKD